MTAICCRFTYPGARTSSDAWLGDRCPCTSTVQPNPGSEEQVTEEPDPVSGDSQPVTVVLRPQLRCVL